MTEQERIELLEKLVAQLREEVARLNHKNDKFEEWLGIGRILFKDRREKFDD